MRGNNMEYTAQRGVVIGLEQMKAIVERTPWWQLSKRNLVCTLNALIEEFDKTCAEKYGR